MKRPEPERLREEGEILESMTADDPGPASPASVRAPGLHGETDADETSTADLAGASGESVRLRDQLQRLRAEFDNYRKRNVREREEWWRRAQADVMVRLLPVIDDYRRSLDHTARPGDPPDPGGMVLVLKRLGESLAQCGLTEMDVRPGTVFDPEQHEAVMACPSAEYSEGHVVQVFDAGWLLGGQPLRHCKVSVSSGPPEE